MVFQAIAQNDVQHSHQYSQISSSTQRKIEVVFRVIGGMRGSATMSRSVVETLPDMVRDDRRSPDDWRQSQAAPPLRARRVPLAPVA